MTILIVARKPGNDWGILKVFEEGFREDAFQIGQRWRNQLPGDEEVRVVSIPREDGSKCSETISLKRMKVIGS